MGARQNLALYYKSSYIRKNLLIGFTISRLEGRKSSRKSSDSLKNPFTQQNIPNLKVFGFKVSAFVIVYKALAFVMNSVIFGTGIVPLCVNAKTNPVPKITGFIANPVPFALVYT